VNWGRYRLTTAVRENEALRASFNELTRKTFGFDFALWHARGGWGEDYVPHALVDGGRIVANVSVNRMRFQTENGMKNYIQLGTVMTDPEYRMQGLGRALMECVLARYAAGADGIYLFANDSVLNYYPRFGFRPMMEYETVIPAGAAAEARPYALERVDLEEPSARERFDAALKELEQGQENDALFMSANRGLYQFWLDGEYADCIYFIPERSAYAVVATQGERAQVLQVFGRERVDLLSLVRGLGAQAKETALGYTPIRRDGFAVQPVHEEDCTLFVLGEDLWSMERERLRFPALSHA